MNKLKIKFTLILLVAFSLLLSVLILVGCNGGTAIDEEVFTLYINVNYEGGENFTREIRRERLANPENPTMPTDIIIDRGDEFHLIGFSVHGNDTIGVYTRGRGFLNLNWFCENNTLELRAEWFDLRLHNAFHATMAKETYAIVELGVVTQAEHYVDGNLYRAYREETITSWFENGTLYADRSLTGHGFSRITDFNPVVHRGLVARLSPIPSHSIKRRVMIYDGLSGWIESISRDMENGSVNTLISRRNSMQTDNDNVFNAGPRDFMVKDGLIAMARNRGTDRWPWRFYFDTEDLENFAERYIPPRVGNFVSSYIFTAELASNSNINEISMRGDVDWMPVGEYTIAQLTARVEVRAVGGNIVSNPILRFFRNSDGTDEVIDSILLDRHTTLYVRLVV